MAQFRYGAQDFAELGLTIRRAMVEIYTALRGFLTLHDNVRKYEVEHTFVSASTTEDIDISDLGISWVPARIWVVEVDRAAIVWPADRGNWTNQLVKAQCNTIGATVVLTVY